MRLILSSIFVLGSLAILNPKPEDLLNTTWSGKINAPDPVDAEMEFRKDTLFTYIGPELIETSAFKIKGDTLILQKISGLSSCDQQPADYRYSVKDDVLVLEALNDSCQDRKGAFPTEGFKKVK